MPIEVITRLKQDHFLQKVSEALKFASETELGEWHFSMITEIPDTVYSKSVEQELMAAILRFFTSRLSETKNEAFESFLEQQKPELMTTIFTKAEKLGMEKGMEKGMIETKEATLKSIFTQMPNLTNQEVAKLTGYELDFVQQIRTKING
jgi:succinate dehydrogenase flavin-adding protein (antitoxin of CptAB toxin-antitoxin module)